MDPVPAALPLSTERPAPSLDDLFLARFTMQRTFGLALTLLLATSRTVLGQDSLKRLGSFKTPSGNIHCEEWDVGAHHQAELRCDVLSAAEHPTARRPRDCELDYGYAFMLTKRKKAWLLCGGDTIVDPSHAILTYGETWRGTAATCTATLQFLRCRNQDGHGFELSKRVQRLF